MSKPRSAPSQASMSVALKDGISAAAKLNIDHTAQRYGGVRTIPLQLGLPPTLIALFLLLAGLMSLIWGGRLAEMKELAVSETNQTALALAAKLENTTNLRIVSLISQWYEFNYKAFAVLSRSFKMGVMGRSDFDKMYWLFLSTVQENPTMTGLVFADAQNGAFLAISRMDNGSYTFELQSTPSSGLTCTICPTLSIPAAEKWYYLIDASTERPFPTPYLRAEYSMTSRPWYTTAIAANRATWSEFYRRSNGLTGQMNLGQPMFASSGAEPWGVFSLEASAQPITNFLRAGVADMPATTAYVMDNKYRLMGTSANESVLVDQVQIAAVNSTNFFTQTTAPAVISMLRTGGASRIVRSARYWYQYVRYTAEAGALAVIVAGTPSIEYTGTLDRVQGEFASSFAQSIRDATLIAVAFALLCATLAFVVLHKTVIRPLKDVCAEMVLASKLEFQALTNGQHHMRPSHVRELNKVQYSFRALVAEFANGLKKQSRRGSSKSNNTNSMLKGETRSLAVGQSASVTDALFARTPAASGSVAGVGTRGLVKNTRTMS